MLPVPFFALFCLVYIYPLMILSKNTSQSQLCQHHCLSLHSHVPTTSISLESLLLQSPKSYLHHLLTIVISFLTGYVLAFQTSACPKCCSSSSFLEKGKQHSIFIFTCFLVKFSVSHKDILTSRSLILI